jgi:hypothetical protein
MVQARTAKTASTLNLSSMLSIEYLRATDPRLQDSPDEELYAARDALYGLAAIYLRMWEKTLYTGQEAHGTLALCSTPHQEKQA